MKRRDLKPGTKFGRLVVVQAAGLDPVTKKSLSLCKCDCGAVVVKRNNDLLTGRVVSCGCLKRERSSRMMWNRAEKSNANHMSGTPLYRCWRDMVRRCSDGRHPSYGRYGAKGITVCKSWTSSFRRFRTWAMSHGFRDGLEIDRIDFRKGYVPSNCRFVDVVAQANNRSDNRYIEYKGETLTVAQWARKLNLPYHTIKAGTKKGKTLEYYERKQRNQAVRLAETAGRAPN